MTQEKFKEKAIKIMGEFGLPNVPEMDFGFKEIFARVENECSMAEDMHKSFDGLLSEWEADNGMDKR